MNAESEQPVYVVSGLPRSGTSMMMQMLDAGGLAVLTDRIRSADDDNPQGYYELEAVKRSADDTGWVCEAPGKAVKIIYRLLEYLPADFRYRVLFMDRPLGQVIASQQVMLERRGSDGATVSNDQLQALFSSELQRVKSWLEQQANFEWIGISHAAVLNNGLVEAERIRKFLDVDLDVQAMAARVDRQLHRQRS